jgi:ribonucleoside-triphosphate reductase (thioredoxin)
MDVFQQFILTRTYSRYLPGEGRRETWGETVGRYCEFAFANPLVPEKVRRISREKILSLDVMPSMRALWSAGPAAQQSNVAMYNCSFVAVDDLAAFGEVIFLLMCGTGCGFSVEDKYVSKLPAVKAQRNVPGVSHTVSDSRCGWKEALDLGIQVWFEGRDVRFDFSCLRAMGTPLLTMGGRSSGGEVLRQLLAYAKEVILGAQGRQLTSMEVHSILCEVASVVVVGGTRRSALISLSDLTNKEMRHCKDEGCHPRMFGSNNSAVYVEEPDIFTFMAEWAALAWGGRGERGIFNLGAAKRNSPKRRKGKLIAGTNPCGEINLRSQEFCNLSEVVVRADDDFESLRDKITTAVWLGIVQSTFTDFSDLRPEWQENCQDEHLLGVSLTGQLDNASLLTPEVLRLSKTHAINVARSASKKLGIPMPAAITTTKPSGTVSQLVDSSAGLHPRWSEYYIRNIMISVQDPLFQMMAAQNVPWAPVPNDPHTAYLSFPRKSPDGAIVRAHMTALDQLKHYLKVATEWTEHNPSCTIYVRKHEWLSVASWVFDNFKNVNGLSFFPADESEQTYPWLPYVQIDKDEYERRLGEFPEIDFEQLPQFEKFDSGEGAKELACSGGACDV